MNEIVRRIIMMIGIVSIGTILIFFNASVIITITATLAFGVIMAMGLGLLKGDDFKNIHLFKKKTTEKPELNKTEKTVKEDKQDRQEKKSVISGNLLSRFRKKEKTENQKPKASEPAKKGKSQFTAGLSAAISSISTSIHKSRDAGHSEKIDTLLKTTIDEPVISSSDDAALQPELVLTDDKPGLSDENSEFSDEMDFFDEEDFGSLDDLEIEGEDKSFDFDMDLAAEPETVQKDNSDELNMDDEINSILLAGNAFDEDEDFLSDVPDDAVSQEIPPVDADADDDTDTEDLIPEEDSFTSEEFFVQGIEDGLDEQSFINLPDPLTDNQTDSNLTDSLDELNNLTEFEKMNLGDDEFSNFDAIDLDELETEDLSIDIDDIVIEEDEDIDDTDIMPDDFIPLSDASGAGDGTEGKSGSTNSLFDSASSTIPEIETPISFSGKNEYDDIMGALESDAKRVTKVSQKSLVRDMMDVHVDAKDLVEELETVLNSMGGKPQKTVKHNERSEK